MRVKEKEHQRRKYEKRRREKRCMRCGGPRYSPILGENFKTCSSCREQRRTRYTVKKREKPPAIKKQFCKAMGICGTCRRAPIRATPKKNGKPYATCESCLDRARKAHIGEESKVVK